MGLRPLDPFPIAAYNKIGFTSFHPASHPGSTTGAFFY